jgi:hypothetical protein
MLGTTPQTPAVENRGFIPATTPRFASAPAPAFWRRRPAVAPAEGSHVSTQDRQIAQSLLADPAIPVAEIAKRLNVSKNPFYRHFPGGRSAPKPILS